MGADQSAVNRFVYDPRFADSVAESILHNGVLEPLTGLSYQCVKPKSTGQDWRESLVFGGINSRMRAVMSLICEKTKSKSPYSVRIFAAEAITAFALKLRGIYPRFIGSEFAFNEQQRETLFPIPHQDLLSLTFPSDSFDLVTTNEVLEHVPDIDRALREISRVLRPGGWHVGTLPFIFTRDVGVRRAIISNGVVTHLRSPEYHGNPVSPDGGSLVYEIPGWDLIQRTLDAGFSNAHMRFVASERHGYISSNTGIFVLCAQK